MAHVPDFPAGARQKTPFSPTVTGWFGEGFALPSPISLRATQGAFGGHNPPRPSHFPEHRA